MMVGAKTRAEMIAEVKMRREILSKLMAIEMPLRDALAAVLKRKLTEECKLDDLRDELRRTNNDSSL